MTDDATVVVELPDTLRGELKAPMGPVFTDPAELYAHVEGRLIAVGDIVTFHFEQAGITPDVAVVDGRTKREAVSEEVRETLDTAGRRFTVTNPPGTLTQPLLEALVEAVASEEPVVLAVDGEEDLAVLAAILAAESGASVVYGQPDEGMVHVGVTPDMKSDIADIVARMSGDPERLFSITGYSQ